MFENLDAVSFLGATGFGGIVTGAAFSVFAIRKIIKSTSIHRQMLERLAVSMDAARRFLSSPHAPRELRLPLLVALKGMSSDTISAKLAEIMSENDASSNDGSLALAVARLRLEYPELADDFDEAAFGIVAIGLPLKAVGPSATPPPRDLYSPQKAVGRIGKLTHHFGQLVLPLGA